MSENNKKIPLEDLDFNKLSRSEFIALFSTFMAYEILEKNKEKWFSRFRYEEKKEV